MNLERFLTMDEETEEDLTPEEVEALETAGYGYPKAEEKQNIYNYFKKVILMKDNTKTGNLTKEEIGMPLTPVRTNQEIALYCQVMGMKNFGQYFQDDAQIMLGTSLSREGFLDKLAVTQKRESEFKTRHPLQTKQGWFAKKKPMPEEF